MEASVSGINKQSPVNTSALPGAEKEVQPQTQATTPQSIPFPYNSENDFGLYRQNEDGSVTNILEDGKITWDEVRDKWSWAFFQLVAGDDNVVSEQEFLAQKAAIKYYADVFNVSLSSAVKLYVSAEGFDIVNINNIAKAKEKMWTELKPGDGKTFLYSIKDHGCTGSNNDVYMNVEAFHVAYPDATDEEQFNNFFRLFEASRYGRGVQKDYFSVNSNLYRASTGQAKDVEAWFKGDESASRPISDSSAKRALQRMNEQFVKRHADPYKALEAGRFDSDAVESYFEELEKLYENYQGADTLSDEMLSYFNGVFQGIGKAGLDKGTDLTKIDKALKWVDKYDKFVSENRFYSDSDKMTYRENTNEMKAFIAMRKIDMGSGLKDISKQDVLLSGVLKSVEDLPDVHRATVCAYVVTFLAARGRNTDAANLMDPDKGFNNYKIPKMDPNFPPEQRRQIYQIVQSINVGGMPNPKGKNDLIKAINKYFGEEGAPTVASAGGDKKQTGSDDKIGTSRGAPNTKQGGLPE